MASTFGVSSNSGYAPTPAAISMDQTMPCRHVPAGGGTAAPVAEKSDPESANTQAYSELKKFAVVGDLGKGAFGVVKKVIHRDIGQTYAMKILEKRFVVQRGLEEQMRSEVLIQFKVKHDHIVALKWFFEDEFKIYCLLEYADQGQLFAYLRDQERGVAEPQAAQFFADTSHGVQYLHSRNIAHRDIKPENIMLFTKARRAKIGDLGWCVELTPEEPTSCTFCGTLDYMAPEILSGEPHDTSVDLWALGVLLYEMLMASAPFAAKSQKEATVRICSVRYEVPPGSMSPGPRDLIASLLVRDAPARSQLQQVLRHPWVVTLAGSRPTAHANEDPIAATRAVPRGGVASATAQNDMLAATRAVPSRAATPAAQAPLVEATPVVPRTVSAPSQASASPSTYAAPPAFELTRAVPREAQAPAVDRPVQHQLAPQGEDRPSKHVLEQATVVPDRIKSAPSASTQLPVGQETLLREGSARVGALKPGQPSGASFLAASALNSVKHQARDEISPVRSRLAKAAEKLTPVPNASSASPLTPQVTPPRSPFILPVSLPTPPRLSEDACPDIVADSELLSHVEDSRINLCDLDNDLLGTATSLDATLAIRHKEKEFRSDGTRRRTQWESGAVAASDDKVPTASTVASTADDLTSEVSEDFVSSRRMVEGSGPMAKRRSRRRENTLPARLP